MNLYGFVTNDAVDRLDHLGKSEIEIGLGGALTEIVGLVGMELGATVTFTLPDCKKCVAVNGHMLFGAGALGSIGAGPVFGWGDNPGSSLFGPGGHAMGQTQGVGGGAGLPAPPEGEPLGATGSIDVGVAGSSGGGGGVGHFGPTLGVAAYYRRGVYCKACASILKGVPMVDIEILYELGKCLLEAARNAEKELGLE